MLFDTDVLVWAQRGSKKAIEVLSDAAEPAISAFSYMELMQGLKDKKEARILKDFLQEGCFQIMPLTENISHRASVYIEEYALSHGLRAGDAIVAATAIENGYMLVSGNQKHFRQINELRFRKF